METKKATALAIICLFTLLAVSLTSVSAQSTGVAKGDKFTYEYALHGSHTDGAYWAVRMPDENQSSWILNT